MKRGVRNNDRQFSVMRKRTARRGTMYATQYSLNFYYNGGGKIHVNFQYHKAHNVINVYDYRKGEPTITTRSDFLQAVNDYMRTMDDHDLKAHWDNRPRVQVVR